MLLALNLYLNFPCYIVTCTSRLVTHLAGGRIVRILPQLNVQKILEVALIASSSVV